MTIEETIKKFRKISRITVNGIQKFIQDNEELLSEKQSKNLDKAIILIKTGNKLLNKDAKKDK